MRRMYAQHIGELNAPFRRIFAAEIKGLQPVAEVVRVSGSSLTGYKHFYKWRPPQYALTHTAGSCADSVAAASEHTSI